MPLKVELENLPDESIVVVLSPGIGSCGNSSRQQLHESDVVSTCHPACLTNGDPVGWLVVALADKDPLLRPGIQLAEVPFVVDESTGPDSPQKGQGSVLAEHSVVRRVATDSLVWQVVESKHYGGRHFPPKKLPQRSSVQHAPGHVHYRVPVRFAEVVLFQSVGRAEVLNDRRDFAVAVVIVGDDLTTTIGAQMLEAKPERYD